MSKNTVIVVCGCLAGLLAGCGAEGKDVGPPVAKAPGTVPGRPCPGRSAPAGAESGEQFFQRICPDPDVKEDFWQAVAFLELQKGTDPLPVVCEMVSDEWLSGALEQKRTVSVLRGFSSEWVDVLRSRMRVRIIGEGQSRLIAVYVGGYRDNLDAMNIAHALVENFLGIDHRICSQHGVSVIVVLNSELEVVRKQREAAVRQMDEIRKESAVPQMTERGNLLSARQQELQAQMMQLDTRADELSRSMETLKKAVAAKDFKAIPDVEKRVPANDEVRAVQAAVLRLRMEKADAAAPDDAGKDKAQTLEKRLAAMQALLAETRDRVLQQMVRDYGDSLEAGLSEVRAHRLKAESIYRADLASIRDLMERMNQLARLKEQVDELSQVDCKVVDKLRELNIEDRRDPGRTRFLGVYDLSATRRKPVPLPEPTPASMPAE